jgi:curved DNA-binding protein CbpA
VTSERDAYDVLQVDRAASWAEIRGAYRTLARRYHPDWATPDTARMAEVNSAYERLEREHGRGAEASRGVPVGPGKAAVDAPSTPAAPVKPSYGPLMGRVMAARRMETPVIDFGQYAGWRIAEIAEHDPRYLQWLSRHSSGVRFRAVIERVLGSGVAVGRRAALVR